MSLTARLNFYLRKFRFDIRPTDLVLDVGSGNDPHPRADLLCDKFVLDDTERQGGLVLDRPLVGGELERLPFKDKSIDFALATHVLEHVDDPAAAVAELARVAKRGYVETPAEFGGKLLDLPGHRWYVRKEGGTLVFTGKSKGMFDGEMNRVGFTLWQAKDPAFMRLFWSHRDLFFVEHHWEGSLDCEVVRPDGELFEPEEFFHANVEEPVMDKTAARSPKERLKGAIRDYYRSSFYGPKRPVDLAALCACPACRADLIFEAEAVRCTGCGASYPLIRRGAQAVPMLITSR